VLERGFVEAGSVLLEIGSDTTQHAVRVGTDSKALTGDAEGFLAELVDGLAFLMSNQDALCAVPSNAEDSDLLPKLDRLQALLEAYDGEAGDLVSELELLAAATEFARPIREIGKRIDDFEFD